MPPKPTPTKTLEMRGSWRADTRPDEPMPEPLTTSKPPASLHGRAKEVWTELAPRLMAVGLLTLVDSTTFTRYCRLLAAWESAMEEVEGGSDRAAVLTLAKLDEMVRKLEANFGLTPADRTGIAVPEQPATDDKSRFFKTG